MTPKQADQDTTEEYDDAAREALNLPPRPGTPEYEAMIHFAAENEPEEVPQEAPPSQPDAAQSAEPAKAAAEPPAAPGAPVAPALTNSARLNARFCPDRPGSRSPAHRPTRQGG